MELMTVRDVARALGKEPRQVRYMVKVGSAPRSALIGGRRMFRTEDFEKWVDAQFGGQADE